MSDKSIFVLVKDDGLVCNTDQQCAVDGFAGLDYRIKPIKSHFNFDLLLQNIDKPHLLSIDLTKILIKKVNPNFEWVEKQLFQIFKSFADRHIEIMTVENVLKELNGFACGKSLFVKPVETKLFDGIVVQDESSLNYFKRMCGGIDNLCIVSSVISDIRSEFRCFVHNHELVDCRNYKGDFKILPDFYYIEDIISEVSEIENAPIAYTVDVMIDDIGQTEIIEFNDFWCIGNYGLDSETYALMLKDRWNQIFSNGYKIHTNY